MSDHQRLFQVRDILALADAEAVEWEDQREEQAEIQVGVVSFRRP